MMSEPFYGVYEHYTSHQAVSVLVRLGVGIYAKAKPSVLTGEPIPAQP